MVFPTQKKYSEMTVEELEFSDYGRMLPSMLYIPAWLLVLLVLHGAIALTIYILNPNSVIFDHPLLTVIVAIVLSYALTALKVRAAIKHIKTSDHYRE